MGTRALRIGEFAREIIAEVHGGNVAATTKMEVVAAHVSLLAAAYRNLANYPNEARFSKCLVNPDTQELEFAGMRSTTLALPEQNGYPLYMVAEYVIDRYGRGHHVPGVEYLRWLHRNPGQSPANLKHHGSRHLFFVGSALHHGLGPWKAPCAIWDETEAGFFKWADEFSRTWGPDCRIVLLEKPN